MKLTTWLQLDLTPTTLTDPQVSCGTCPLTYPCLGEVERGGQLGDVDAAQVVRLTELALQHAHLVLREGHARVAAQLPLPGALLPLRACAHVQDMCVSNIVTDQQRVHLDHRPGM